MAIQIGFASVLGPPGAALASGYITAINGGSALDIFKSAIITLATAEAFAGVGSLTDGHFPASNGGLNAANQTPLQWFGSLKHLANVVGHAAIGCASSAAGGGSCQAGALSAGLGAAITPGIPAEFGKVGGLVVTAAVGGTASVVGGGKFANGAVTAAYGYMFNQTAGGIGSPGDGGIPGT
ncbi:MAG: hypothetical protein IT563_01080 [Alphaproteobacteria bacterium]|nr:hypothetical protein [Alphaproteobacteria bacterium]